MNASKLALAATLALALGTAGFAPQTAHAADTGTITINGKVISQTCEITGGAGTNGGSTDFTVTLPVVNASDLSNANQTAGKTNFSLALSNCPTSPTVSVGAKFYSASNVDANGNLSNTATTSAASNVAIQLLDKNDDAIALTSDVASAVNTDSGEPITNGNATLNYAAQYISVPGSATAGNVKTTVTYQITYM